MHKKVKITVLRTEYYQELAEQYAIPNLGKCPFHQKGQVKFVGTIIRITYRECSCLYVYANYNKF